MKTIGEQIFAKDSNGKLASRIGTLFFRTPGLVTKRGVHAMQRLLWLEDVNASRAAAGQPPLTPLEEEAEMSESADLIFTDEFVLIRPDPERMDLALRADEILCQMVGKKRVRYLNTSSAKVREALTGRGENWRMARQPISQEDMTNIVERSKVPIGERPIYYYNGATGTRFITASGYDEVARLPDADYRRQVVEVITGLNKRNRLGQPEIDIFPPSTPIEIKNALKGVPHTELSDAELRRAVDHIDTEWRMSLPAELRDETTDNFEWRNTMCHVITRQPNETNAEEQDLTHGIAPEFYRQIEWLPGARIDRGEVIFDEIFDEAERTRDPELLELCDTRVKALIFNMTRLFGGIDYINVGRITRSLARHPIEGSRRGYVYIVQYRMAGKPGPRVNMIRFQKWGVAERLDEGKNMAQAVFESDEYSDYILDRRLMCRQLGMNLPPRLGFGHLTEKYRGDNGFNGASVRSAYFVRPYVLGVASDKVPVYRFRNPAYARSFAQLMGAAAAIDMIVGRRSSENGAMLFDGNYEVLTIGADGLPSALTVTDHTGSFVEYEHPFDTYIANYADVVKRRKAYVTDYTAFATAYVEAFISKLAATQAAYRERKRAFDELFNDRPFDTNGSGAFRWDCALKRLDAANPEALKALLEKAVAC